MDKKITEEIARRFEYRRKAWFKRNAVQYTLIYDGMVTSYVFEKTGLDPDTEYSFRFQDYILTPEETYGPMATIVATTRAGSYWLEKESFGLGLLDSVFSGKTGLASTLVQQLGGTAVIAYQHTPGYFDDVRGVNSEPVYARQHIAFTDETYKYTAIQRGTTGSTGGLSGASVGGVQVEAGDIVGIVAGYDLAKEITQGNDLLQWNGVTWRIMATEKIFSGLDAAIVRILGRKQHDEQF